MARSVPKCKRAAYVYDRDFIVVDDISGVLKMRSECAIDGYGFLSSQGDIRNPQEIAPIIREQMAAWPDPRPIGPPLFIPEPNYQYFLFNVVVDAVGVGSTTFDATSSVGLNGPISSIVWLVDGVESGIGLIVELTMSSGDHTITATLTDIYQNSQSFNFDYNQPTPPDRTIYTNPSDGDVIFNDDVSNTDFLIIIDDGAERFSGIALFLNQSANYPEGTELLFEVQTNADIDAFQIQDVDETALPGSSMAIPSGADYQWIYQVFSGVITLISFTPG